MLSPEGSLEGAEKSDRTCSKFIVRTILREKSPEGSLEGDGQRNLKGHAASL
jgi:hypothetical protein